MAAAEGTPAAPSPAPAAPPAPAAAATPPPAAAKPQPQGDDAAMHAHLGASALAFDVLEDGAGVTTVALEDLFSAARWAKERGYTLLSLLSAYDRGDHFGVLYALVRPAGSPKEFAELRLRATMPKAVGGQPAEPACPSLVDLFPAADWQEREMYDMYGIVFQGHPDLRRMFLPDGWTGHPMRKDYKEPEQYVAMRDGEDIVVRQPEEGAW